MISKTVLIVEDDLIIAKSIRSLLEEKGFEVSAIASSGKQAIEEVKVRKPDVILMDIELKGNIDGITTARTILKNVRIPIIFVTDATDDLVFENAKEVQPISYITKPFNDTDLYRAVELALSSTGYIKSTPAPTTVKIEDGIFVRSNGMLVKLKYSDILFLEAKGAYTKIHVDSLGNTIGNYIIAQSSNHVIEKLQLDYICKVHRSFYVNLDKIDAINNDELFIKGNAITIGSDYKNSLMNRLNILKNTKK